MSRKIDYGTMMHRALRGLIVEVLRGVEQEGLPGDHHFFITIDMRHPDMQIADWLDEHLAPRGIGVVVEAEHLCMSMRGVHATGTSTVTSAVRGRLRENESTRREFLDLIRG